MQEVRVRLSAIRAIVVEMEVRPLTASCAEKPERGRKVSNRRFAKIIELPATQVLCYIEYDEEDDVTTLHQIFVSDGGRRVDAVMHFRGEDQEERAYQTLACLGRKEARILLRKMEGALAAAGRAGHADRRTRAAPILISLEPGA